MKNVFRISALIFLLIACESFDQEAFDRGYTHEEDLEEYQVPTTFPNKAIEFDALLHGIDAHKWVAKEVYLAGFPGNQECRLDDHMILRKNGTYQFDGGKMSCGGNDVSTKHGVYTKDYANQQLIFDAGTSNEVVVQVSGLKEGVIALSTKVIIFGVPIVIDGVYVVE